jgi:hypothetical protein
MPPEGQVREFPQADVGLAPLTEMGRPAAL